jgi:outer membrane protein OmpA-like peptidoglycan-associated protein
MWKQLLAFLFVLALMLPAFAQETSEGAERIANPYNTPVYRINVVERTTKAIDYRKGDDEVKFDMAPTSLLPDAKGHAKVKSHRDRTEIEAKFDDMKPATIFGPEYLTYVLWAITPEGRPVNLGEVQVHLKHDDDSEIKTTTPLQAFGLIVTAEPYAEVTRPSNLVVLENQINSDIQADVHPIDAHFETLNRGEYRVDLNPSDLPLSSQTEDTNTPLELLEAENAIAIAKAAGAKQYASDSLVKAETFLNQARNDYRRKQESDGASASKSAAQTAEDARLIALRKQHEEQLAQKRAEQQQQLSQAQAQAQARQQEAEQARLEAQRQQQAQQQAEAARQEALQAAQVASQQRQQAELARQQAIEQQQQAQLQAQQAQQARLQAEQQAQQTRERLLHQLNSVLQTRESARGLIVNMNDVLFDVDKATLKPGAQVRLAKVAGIVMAYPDLKLQVEGFTDSTGSEQYNQELSDRRAQSVREFLAAQGVPADNITSHGYGESEPIATNDTVAGRQLNRRVELVVSGNAIGQNQVPNNGTTPAQNGSQQGAIAAPSTNNHPQ